ncbi:hypothetical protein PSE10C_57340 [Pseudomonas amygdali pv. eriobotryae]|nr:hypothetical protein AL052_01390 [Pseudomonas amygdali pv. eriobotryae]GFZ74992.1 hypothetical protein PSE10C_57340 [Pseudomonas amygdali pv. eriobotryae]
MGGKPVLVRIDAKQLSSGSGEQWNRNQRKAWLEFAFPVRWCGLANFDLQNEFIAPIFGALLPSVVLAEAVS